MVDEVSENLFWAGVPPCHSVNWGFGFRHNFWSVEKWKVSKPLLECKYLWPIMLTSVELTQQLGCSIKSFFLNIVMHWVHPERSLGLWTACLVKLRTVVQKDWETLSVALLVCNKGWGQNAKLGPHSVIWGKLGTALQAYALNPCTKFPPNPTSRKVNT